ncbi:MULTISPECIES: cob(I)yrinic acid a,c-diamide adenosyltransferase [Clostridium]|uniref:Corrinoid adenosyltransferase n=1 Tax=Clostridium cadaveris TaxID=1529 RepID=A0A1I2M2Y6_9CLOT|nr:cob(I)yrinic acid a,c-diamide adenosyltransferase [Clostridium cadaveris]MDU4950742.1 cob(I)yrinic acid a,c-diamide adenosyltransferase [Clostridium sp.]MDM8312404.1 cob(I)yrinic acid a,c-diamide adenosyltransferase [Clostridium cadaveris]MDY4948593.1 cob(I)yrinic acid a,c-diamide adenosyltransferase [Clostridium cadaveris]NME63656.1 cob(I)yrinic acid a,c-diamide adenosyltransferase [Clostridium cadaveris]NWK12634.1 cob(I)yrinic acid a,c-diamide adenosyltransferase [Clostridium cadaveris]
MQIYTKTGDKGQTSLFDGTRVDKDSDRVEAYGTIDELSSFIGLADTFVEDKEINEILLRIQKKLFFVAGQIATIDKEKFKYKIKEGDIKELEDIIDKYIAKTPKVDAFIVPGTSKASASLHVARTVCRRAERRVIHLRRIEDVEILVKYINRLSDTLYALARYLEKEIIPMNFEDAYNE